MMRQPISRGRLRWLGAWLCSTALAAGGLAGVVPGVAFANPQGGSVVGGAATISQAPGSTTVTQSSPKAVIDWQRFSIDKGETTRFVQPDAHAIALNRVRGGERSDLLGRLQANGQVWLVNPNGVLIGPDAKIDVAGFLATTADIANADFMAGRFDFSIPSSNPDAAVVNQGTISVRDTGLAALVAPHTRNEGLIEGRYAQVVVGGAPTFAVDFRGDGLISFQATSKVAAVADPSQPLVENSGTISADGGRVLLTAAAAAGVVEHAIDTTGVIEARTVAMHGGEIILDGGEHGIVAAAGTLDAAGDDAGETGGTVKVLGEKVALLDGAAIDVSGDAGGGTALVGGNFQGKGQERNARRTVVAKGAKIAADAKTTGDGGKVVVWADEATGFSGAISARGGAEAGNGGNVEVSGKRDLAFHGQVDVGAPNGTPGTLLLDPENITIVADGGANDDQITDGQILADDSPGASFTIDASSLNLLVGDVRLEATNDIVIAAGVGTLSFVIAASATISADADHNGVGRFGTKGDTDIVTSDAPLTITAADFATTGLLQLFTVGGDITLDSRNGTLTASAVSAFPGVGGVSGGNILVHASGSVVMPYVQSTGVNAPGGNIAITSDTGTVTLDSGALTADSLTGIAGTITINAAAGVVSNGPILTGGVVGGDVTVNSTAGSVSIPLANVSGSDGTAGNISITAGNGIIVGTINASSASGFGGGDVSLDAGGGLLTLNAPVVAHTLNARSSADVTVDPGFAPDISGAIALAAGNNLNINTPVTHNGLGVSLTAGNQLVLNQPVIATGDPPADGTSILVQANALRNNVTSQAALQPGVGRFLAYLANPANDQRGGLAGQKRYNTTFASTPPTDASLVAGTNYLLYSLAPQLTLTAGSGTRAYGDPNPALAVATAGLIDGDSVANALTAVPFATTTAVQSSDPGSYPTTVEPVSLASPLGYTLVLVDGALTVEAPTVGATPGTNRESLEADVILVPPVVSNPTLSDAVFSSASAAFGGRGETAVATSSDEETAENEAEGRTNEETKASTRQRGLIAYAPVQPQLLPYQRALGAADDAADWSAGGNRGLWGLDRFPTAAGPAAPAR